jgi:hypothetical protein
LAPIPIQSSATGSASLPPPAVPGNIIGGPRGSRNQRLQNKGRWKNTSHKVLLPPPWSTDISPGNGELCQVPTLRILDPERAPSVPKSHCHHHHNPSKDLSWVCHGATALPSGQSPNQQMNSGLPCAPSLQPHEKGSVWSLLHKEKTKPPEKLDLTKPSSGLEQRCRQWRMGTGGAEPEGLGGGQSREVTQREEVLESQGAMPTSSGPPLASQPPSADTSGEC